jgi:hypothetical protein
MGWPFRQHGRWLVCSLNVYSNEASRNVGDHLLDVHAHNNNEVYKLKLRRYETRHARVEPILTRIICMLVHMIILVSRGATRQHVSGVLR